MDVEQQSPAGREVSGRLLTLPNVLSVLRLIGLPLFLWAIVSERDLLALLILLLSGITDYLDGKIARRYNMETRLGQFLDPIADRLYIATTLVGLAWREMIPVWLVVVLLLREVVMAAMLLYLRQRGQIGMPVHFVGKAATFNLLCAFPFLLAVRPRRLDRPDRRADRLGVHVVGRRALLVRRRAVCRPGPSRPRAQSPGGDDVTRRPTLRRRPSRPARRPDASMTLLTSMLERPLDPSYQAAADRRRAAGEAAGDLEPHGARLRHDAADGSALRDRRPGAAPQADGGGDGPRRARVAHRVAADPQHASRRPRSRR